MVLNKVKLPSTVIVGGIEYAIHTDYRYFINMSETLKDKDMKADALDFMYIDVMQAPQDKAASTAALLRFMNPPRLLPRVIDDNEDETSNNGPCIDYMLDADLIYSAFMQQYNIDLIDIKELHWYKFVALLQGLQSCKLTDVIGFRLYEDDGSKSENNKNQLKLKKEWEIETDEERAAKDEKLQAFNDFIGD